MQVIFGFLVPVIFMAYALGDMLHVSLALGLIFSFVLLLGLIKKPQQIHPTEHSTIWLLAAFILLISAAGAILTWWGWVLLLGGKLLPVIVAGGSWFLRTAWMAKRWM